MYFKWFCAVVLSLEKSFSALLEWFVQHVVHNNISYFLCVCLFVCVCVLFISFGGKFANFAFLLKTLWNDFDGCVTKFESPSTIFNSISQFYVLLFCFFRKESNFECRLKSFECSWVYVKQLYVPKLFSHCIQIFRVLLSSNLAVADGEMLIWITIHTQT